MNGNAPGNGTNMLYDEMLEDLCASEGSDRLEFWKQICLKREYTYQRTTPVKGADGVETHQTMRLRTSHVETHFMCARCRCVADAGRR